MRKMPTHVHGVVDYVVGAALMILPRALGWHGTPARLLEGAGAGAIAYKACSRTTSWASSDRCP